MARTTDELKDEQKIRATLFPRDRIAFVKGNFHKASEDAMTFWQYKIGKIPLIIARIRIADNNYLPEVTEEQFMNEYRLCGYEHLKISEDEYGRYY